MSRMKIKDIAVQKNERVDNPSQSPYSIFVGLEHYDSGEATIRRFGSTERLESAMKVFHAGDMLVARRNVYLKRAATVSFDGLTSGDSIVLHIANEEIRRIIPFVLNSDDFWDYANRHADGSMSKRLSPKLLMEYEFSIPDDNLHQAADILWAMERVKNAYRELIARTDDLVKSQFIEMTQGTKWHQRRMGDLATYINGAAFKPKDWSRDGKPIIRIQNLNNPEAEFNYYSGVLDNKYLVNDGDVLVSWATHLEAYIWNGPEAWLNQHIFKVVFNKGEIDKVFFIYAANVALKEAFKMAHGFKATMEHIKRGDFENAAVMVPDIEVQRQFSEFANQSDKSKFVASNRNLSRCLGIRKRIIWDGLP